MPSALLVLSSGIGNVVRWTPCIAMLHGLGYSVDVWLQVPDYPEVADLLRGAPQIRTLFTATPNGSYDLTCVSHWARMKVAPASEELYPVAGRVDWMPTELWRQVGDPGAMLWHASKLNWTHPIPAPFVMKSGRQFDLPAGTLAIHAGCKAGWPWKRYGSFPAVAQHFESVVVLGTVEDVIAEGWPEHVKVYTGQLSLLDTAALISQCAALISNDSGLSHVGAALGIPTFPIYGSTHPKREMMPLPNVHPIELRAECHESCRAGGRCPGRPSPSRCLTRLHPDVVADYVRSVLPVLV